MSTPWRHRVTAPRITPLLGVLIGAAGGGIGHIRGVQVPGVRRAGVNENRPTARIPGLLDGQRPAIWRADGVLHVSSYEPGRRQRGTKG